MGELAVAMEMDGGPTEVLLLLLFIRGRMIVGCVESKRPYTLVEKELQATECTGLHIM